MPLRNSLRVPCLAGLLSCGLLISCFDQRDPLSSNVSSMDAGQVWLDSNIHSMESRIEAVRGEPFTGTIKGVCVSRSNYDSLMSALGALSGGSSSTPSWDMSERTMVALGMVDSLGQWDGAQSSFDKSSVTGFYLPTTKTLYVFDDVNERDRLYTVAHEMVHVLQDQVVGLSAFDARVREADERMALLNEEEGEAEYVATEVLTGDTSASAMQSRVDAYAYTLDQLASELSSWGAPQGLPLSMTLPQMAPYLIGPELVAARRSRSGWLGVDSFYTNPLRTTRAVIHPYLADTLRDWNPGGCPAVSGAWRPLQTGRLGALYLSSIVYGTTDSLQDLQTLAYQWRGDRFWTFEGDSGLSLLWRTSWQNASAAKSFARTWWKTRALRRDQGEINRYVSVDDSLKTASTYGGGRSALVQVRGSEVVIAEGFSSVEARYAAAKLLDLPDRTVFAARGTSSFGGGEWTPPRPPVSLPPPRIPGLPR